MSELITLQKRELLSLLRQAYEEGWLGYRELAESEADYLLEEYLRNNPSNICPGGSSGGPMPPQMSSYVMAGLPQDMLANNQLEIGDTSGGITVANSYHGDIIAIGSNSNSDIFTVSSNGPYGNPSLSSAFSS